jgi:outer membrane protein assembly factor BamA
LAKQCSLETTQTFKKSPYWAERRNFAHRMPLLFTQNLRCFLACCCLLFVGSALCAQATLRLAVAPSERAAFERHIAGFRPAPVGEIADFALFQIPDSSSTTRFCGDLLEYFRSKSHLAASIDSLRGDSATATALLCLGPEIRWASLRPASRADANWLAAAGFRPQLFDDRPLRFDALRALQRRVLEQAENNGYPFATVGLDSLRLAPDGNVSAILKIERQRFFTFKQLKINGDLRLPPSFLPNYLGIRAGSPYSRARVMRLRDDLRGLLFLESTANPSVTFAGDEATVNLFLQKKRASRFDFVIGLLPQPDGKLLLTGTLSAAFQNALNLGEQFNAEFERLRPETQKLDVQASVPYLFGSPFGAAGRLNIFRRDSTWVDAQGDLGVQYLLARGDFLRFFWENKNSSLQKVDTLAVLNARQLPPNLDLRQNGFGLETTLNRLDYRFNPRRGWSLSLKAVAGFNNVQRNNLIEGLRDPEDPAFDFSSLYDSVAGRAARYRAELRGEVFIPFFVRSTLKVGLRGGGVFSGKSIFANEQYRLGGNKLLRGFDEESLFATRFAVLTTEFRLLIGPNSYLAAFGDAAYLENVTNRTRTFLRPLGLGAGLTFETKAGIFGISLAVGRRDVGQSLDLRATKFHLGYVSLF